MPCLADLKDTTSMLTESHFRSFVLKTYSPQIMASEVLVIPLGCMAWHTVVASANATDKGTWCV